MKNNLLYSLIFTVLLSSIFTSVYAQKTKKEYTDFLPKYRSTASDFILSKIVYTDTEMILSFRYVAGKNNDIIPLYGHATNNTWKLTTASHARYAKDAISSKARIFNICINDEQKKEMLAANDKLELKAQKGDIVTCELKFQKFPYTVRAVHLKGGAFDDQGDDRFAINDILIKTASHAMLGEQKQMEQSIKHFYSNQKNVNSTAIKTIATDNEQNNLDKKLVASKSTKTNNTLQKSLEPIDYMPKTLNDIKDLDCNERIILKNVYFQDNKAEFAGRVKAMKTISIIITYLNENKKSKIVLHGHTDIFGNSYQNLGLSKERVLTVKLAMARRGIDRNRIITVYHGGTQPLTRYTNGSAMNRRVEVEVLCAGIIGEIENANLSSSTEPN